MNDLREFIFSMPIIDTHEHIKENEADRKGKNDWMKDYLSAYSKCDLVSAGLPAGKIAFLRDPSNPIQARWEMVEPYWEACRYTGYARALDKTVRELYGIPEICRETVQELQSAYEKSWSRGDHYQYVLKEKSNIAVSIVDENLDCDRRFFRSVVRLDHFVTVRKFEEILAVEERTGRTVCTLDDWTSECERELDSALSAGAVGIKIGLAYFRSLRFDHCPKERAEKEFYEFLKARRDPLWLESNLNVSKEFEDYMVHFILRLANQKHLTVQIHTGMQEGNGNLLSSADPLLLNNLFLEYPHIRFCILHGGFPFQHTVGALCKMFPNVYIDLCWLPIISPATAEDLLYHLLDLVPFNKIMAFGGDYGFVDAVCGHQYFARECVANALERRIRDGLFDLETAKNIAWHLLFGNALRLFFAGNEAELAPEKRND